MRDLLGHRARSQLKLALLRDCVCLKTLAEIEHEARQSGMTGAEIDAALVGRSFEARTAIAIAFACAAKDGEASKVAEARERALRMGMSEEELSAIAAVAEQLLKDAKQ